MLQSCPNSRHLSKKVRSNHMMEPAQPETTDTTAQQKSASAPLGRAMFIIGVAIAALVAFAAISAAPEAKDQSAAAALVFDAFKGISLEARSAIVIDMRSGETLYEKNAEAQL